ncbi:unnamed protein product, partial [Discosporangium mesarthrocarpum]
DLKVRTRSGALLISSFTAIVAGLRQTGCAVLVALLQLAIFREGIALVRDEVSEVLLEADGQGGGKTLRLLQWGVFLVLGLAVYGKLLVVEAARGLSPWVSLMVQYHTPFCAALYVALVIAIVGTLKSPQLIGYQLGQISAAHFISFLVLPSALITFSARAGLLWFLLPSALVIVNDIMAYFCGMLFGRTPLTHLSPKKTW